MPLLRYPGGKTKLKEKLGTLITPYLSGREYREPFFGGGALGLHLMKSVKFDALWVNDFDKGISSLWSAVINQPERLKSLVMDFTPSTEEFYSIKEELVSYEGEGSLEIGFKKLAIHQISYSGLGTKSGSPLGGHSQKSKYKVDCRWSPSHICKNIDRFHKLFSKFQVRHSSCTSFDFIELIVEEGDAVLYLDPPYYEKGNDLYQHGFDEKDHKDLARALRSTDQPWFLSYDDHPRIRELYKGFFIKDVDLIYNITATKEQGKRASRTKSELIISNKEIR